MPQTSLALSRTTGCNSLISAPFGASTAGHQGANRCTGPSISFRIPFRRRRGNELIRSRRPRIVSLRYVLALFRPASPGGPGALLHGQHFRAVLVDHQYNDIMEI